MVANSSSVPRRILRNNGINPMPSGSRRMTAPVTTGPKVVLTMPTPPRQRENFITDFAVVEVGGAGRSAALLAIVLLGCVGRDISLGHITGKRGAIAAARIAAAAAARALQQKALARLHLVAARRLRLVFLRGGEPDDEACPASRRAAGDAARREAALVVAANDGCIFQQLVLAQQAQAAAPFSGAARIRHKLEAGDAAGKLGFENFDWGDVQVAQMRRRGGGAVVAHAAAIGRAHDLVLHGRLARMALGPGDGQRAR